MLSKVIITAPGKVILCGEHAVVYGKEAIACSLNLRTTCVVEVCLNEEITIIIPALNLNRTFDLKDIYSTLSDANKYDPTKVQLIDDHGIIRKLIHGTANQLENLSLYLILRLFLSIAAQSLGGRHQGVTITLTSDLPIAAGLGSSASFGVSIATSFLVLCGFITNEQKNWKVADYELISSWGFVADTVVHGIPSGIDNSIITYGHCLSFKAGHTELLHELDNVKLDVWVVNTMVTRSTKDLVNGVRERWQKLPEIYNSLFDAMGYLTESVKQLLKKINAASSISETEEQMKNLIIINQHLLDCIGVGHHAIADIVGTCTKYGVGCKLTGAGGGGCVFALIPTTLSAEVIDRIENEFKLRGFDWWRTTLGGDGVLVEHSENLKSDCVCR